MPCSRCFSPVFLAGLLLAAHPAAAITAEPPRAPADQGQTPSGATSAGDPVPSPNGFPEIKSSPLYRVVPKGESRTIAFFTALFPDCSSQGPIVVRLTSQPQHGSVTFEEAQSFPRYVPSSPLASCDSKKAPGLKMIYTTQESYEGADAYGLLLIYPDGTASALAVKVMIR